VMTEKVQDVRVAWDIPDLLYSLVQAVDSGKGAAREFQRLVERQSSTNMEMALARTLLVWGIALLGEGKASIALEHLDASLSILRTIAVSQRRTECRKHIADALVRKGRALLHLGRPDEVIEAIDNAIAICRSLANEHDDAVTTILRQALAVKNEVLASPASARREPYEAESGEAAADRFWDPHDAHGPLYLSTAAQPSEMALFRELAAKLARDKMKEGARLIETGAYEEALERTTVAFCVFHELVGQTGERNMSFEFLRAATNHGYVLHKLRRADAAESCFQLIASVYRRLVMLWHMSPIPSDLTAVVRNHVKYLVELGRAVEALEFLTVLRRRFPAYVCDVSSEEAKALADVLAINPNRLSRMGESLTLEYFPLSHVAPSPLPLGEG